MENKKLITVFSLFGVIGVIFYFLHVILGSLFYEGYNPMAQAISDLTASNSPSKNIASLFSIHYGIFTVLFSACFFRYFKQKINNFITFGSIIFCLMTLVSFLGYTFFPLSESGYAGTFQDKMHIIVTILVVIFTVISLILYSIGFLKAKEYKNIGIISICTFVLLLTGVMLLNILPKEYFGIAERINVYSIVIFIGILSIWMHKYIKNKNTGTLHITHG